MCLIKMSCILASVLLTGVTWADTSWDEKFTYAVQFEFEDLDPSACIAVAAGSASSSAIAGSAAASAAIETKHPLVAYVDAALRIKLYLNYKYDKVNEVKLKVVLDNAGIVISNLDGNTIAITETGVAGSTAAAGVEAGVVTSDKMALYVKGNIRDLRGRIATSRLFFADIWVEVSTIGVADDGAGEKTAVLAAVEGAAYALSHVEIRAKVRYQHRKNKPDIITLKNVKAVLSCGPGFSISANSAAKEVVLEMDSERNWR